MGKRDAVIRAQQETLVQNAPEALHYWSVDPQIPVFLFAYLSSDACWPERSESPANLLRREESI